MTTPSPKVQAVHVQIIAEIGMNHDGDLLQAQRYVDAAVACGVDVVKFQLHIAEAETLRDAPNPPYFSHESRYDYFTRTAFRPEQWRKLKDYTESRGVGFLCSVFSVRAVDLLEDLQVQMYKVPSGEVTNLPLIDRIARTQKPVVLSSGMSSWPELDAAVSVTRQHHNQLTVLQCTSEYPCTDEHVGLNVLEELRTRYQCPVGLSDHTMAHFASWAAVTLGACMIERHLTLSRNGYGSDARHSLEPAELTALVSGVRTFETMLAFPVDKNDVERFREMKRVFEKSVVSLVEITAGQTITQDMLEIKKPGTGIPASRIHEVIGQRAVRDVPAHRTLVQADIQQKDASHA